MLSLFKKTNTSNCAAGRILSSAHAEPEWNFAQRTKQTQMLNAVAREQSLAGFAYLCERAYAANAFIPLIFPRALALFYNRLYARSPHICFTHLGVRNTTLFGY
jgi:hypothetical protein